MKLNAITPDEFIARFRARYQPCQTCGAAFLPSHGRQVNCSSCQCNPYKQQAIRELRKAGAL